MNDNTQLKNTLIPLICALLGLGIAISTALISFSYIVLAILVLIVYTRSLSIVFKNKYIMACVIFFVLVLSGTLWSDVGMHDRYKMVFRLSEYALAPLFFLGLQTNNSARYLLRAFVFGSIISAVFSLFAYLFKYPIFQGRHDTIFYWTVFRGHLLHDVFLAIASNFILWKILNFKNINRRVFSLLMLGYILCLFDVMFLVQGRTGEIMMLAMNLSIVLFRFRWRGVIYGLIALIVIVPLLIKFSPAVKNGIASYNNDQIQLEQGNADTSTGLRKQFHANTLILIKERPLFGYGTGSFSYHYNELIKGTNQLSTNNPHGDWYLLAMELGVIGVLSFALIIMSNVMVLLKLSQEGKALGFSLLIGYLIASTQNSFFLDNVSGFAYISLMLAILNKYKLTNTFDPR